MVGTYRHDIHDMLQWASDITRHLVDMISLKLFGTQSTIFTATVRKAPAICKTSTQNLQYVNVAVCMFVARVTPRIIKASDLPCFICWFVSIPRSFSAFTIFPPSPTPCLCQSFQARPQAETLPPARRSINQIHIPSPPWQLWISNIYDSWWLMIWSFTSAFLGPLNLDSQGPEACEGSFSSYLSNLLHILLYSDVRRHTNTVYLSIPIEDSNLLLIFFLQHPSDLAGPGGFRLCRALVQRLQRCRSSKQQVQSIRSIRAILWLGILYSDRCETSMRNPRIPRAT